MRRRWERGGGEEEGLPVLVPVHDAWEDVVGVCARADEQEDDEEEGLEVEEGGLGWLVFGLSVGERGRKERLTILV